MSNRFCPAAFIAAGLVALLNGSVVRAQSLKIGDAAPPLKVSQWVKGSKINGFQKGKMYVVEFWATWCGPCKESIPHLTELQKKNPAVQFIGVSILENNPAGVVPFVKNMGAKMDYAVAMDSIPSGKSAGDGAMATNWMAAAGQNGIPTAFVVDKNSRIAWVGHPMGGLDSVVHQVQAGTFDANAEAARRQQTDVLSRQMRGVAQTARKDPKAAVAQIDKMMASNPKLRPDLAELRYGLQLSYDEKGAYAFARKMVNSEWKNNAMTLNNMSYGITDNGGKLKAPDYDLALTMAERSAALTKFADPTVLDTLAYAYYKKGNKGKALEIQKNALVLAAKMPSADPQLKAELDRHIALFQH